MAIATIAIVLLSGVMAISVSLLGSEQQPWNSSLTMVAIGLVLLVIGLGGGALLRGAAVARLARSHPDAVVFMALREATVAPNLLTFQYRKNNTANVPDTWIPTVVDDRGISVWSSGLRPKELILLQWSEVGAVEAASFTSLTGRRRCGAAIDVRPIRDPLLVSFGFAALGVERPVDHDGVFAIVDAINARRPGGLG